MPSPVSALGRAARPFTAMGAWLRRVTHPVRKHARPHIARVAAAAHRNMRLTVMLCTAVVCACLTAAVALGLQRTYADALDTAEDYARSQAHELAFDIAHRLDRTAAMSVAYLNAVDEGSAATVLNADTERVLNIALADANGRFISAMQGTPLEAKPLPPAAVAQAMNTRVAASYGDPAIGNSPLALIFRADNDTPARFVVVLLNPRGMVPALTMGDSALLTPDGVALALSSGWDRPPAPLALRTRGQGSDLRYIDSSEGRRIAALAPVPGWPLMAATLVRASDALAAWWGSLPIFLFLLVGIPFAGIGFAHVLIRRLEGRDVAERAPMSARLMEHAKETALRTRLADAEKRSLEAERAKTEFLAHMSHELRTPLNAIVGFAEIIEMNMYGPGHEKYIEYAGDIARAARALHVRIGEILELAAIAAEQHQLDESSADTVAIAQACIEQVRGFAQGRDITLEAKLPPLPLARADSTAIKRILIVLLSNALRFTRDGGAIGIEGRSEDDTVVIAVRDSGHGATPQPGLGGKNARERDRSFGLGLAMATALARRMGGSLRISGALDGSALAELRLPSGMPRAVTAPSVKWA